MADFNKKHAVLLTGAAGFIGSNLVEAMIHDERFGKIRMLDNLATGYMENIQPFLNHPKVEWMEGDIRNIDTCLEACKDIDLVCHQAALGSVPRSIKDPITTNEVNIGGMVNILWAMVENKVEKIVFAASSSTYGDSKILPKTEDVIGRPLSPYAVTKYVNELYADVFSMNYNIKYIGLRYFNIYGPKQNVNGPYAAVIPQFISKIIAGESPVINGTGENSRDFTFVDNAVQANFKALFCEREDAWNNIYNIACGERTSLNELFDTLKSISGSDVNATHGPARGGDIPHSLAEISKAQEFLNYNPKVKIDKGLELTYNWFKNNS